MNIELVVRGDAFILDENVDAAVLCVRALQLIAGGTLLPRASDANPLASHPPRYQQLADALRPRGAAWLPRPQHGQPARGQRGREAP